MGDSKNSTAKVKLSDTARIDRRNTILAQLEAALLADKLELEDPRPKKASGADPYNTGTFKRVQDTWQGKRPR